MQSARKSLRQTEVLLCRLLAVLIAGDSFETPNIAAGLYHGLEPEGMEKAH